MPTLSELRSRVRMDEAFNSTVVVSSSDVDLLLNEGAVDLAKRADAMILTATWTAVANAQTYALSGANPKVSNFLDIYWPAGGLIYTQTSGSTRVAPTDFSYTSENRLDTDFAGWRDNSASDTLQHVYLTYSSDGTLSLGVNPKTKTTTPTFLLYYTSRGTSMTDNGHYPWTGSTTNLSHTEPFQKAIAFYALWQLHEVKTLIHEQAQKYRDLYLALAMEFKASQERVFRTATQGLRRDGELLTLQSFGSL